MLSNENKMNTLQKYLSLCELEHLIMMMLLDGDSEQMSCLRSQYVNASVKSRKTTGVGFFTLYELPGNARPLIDKPSFSYGDVIAHLDGIFHGTGFVLHVREGLISMLEGYTYDEVWPSYIKVKSISYTDGTERRGIPVFLQNKR